MKPSDVRGSKSADPLRFHWFSRDLKRYYFLGLAFSGFGAGVLVFGIIDCDPIPLVLGSVFLLFGCSLFVTRKTEFDLEAKLVITEGYLFGRIRLYQKRGPLSHYRAVTHQRIADSEGFGDHIFIGLRPRKGRIKRIRYDNVEIGAASELLVHAAQLAELTGLPLEESAK